MRHGVRFLYRITLGVPDPHFYVPGAKTPSTLPQILNHDELVRLFTVTTNPKHRALLMTAYAAGFGRASSVDCSFTDIDSVRMCLRIEQGKGNKTATSRSRPGCSNNCASTGVASVPSAGCSPISSSPGR